MIYKVKYPGRVPQTYEGFRPFRYSKKQVAPVLAVIPIEGGSEVWRLDPDNIEHAVAELQRFYRSEENLDVDVIVYNNPALFLTDVPETGHAEGTDES